MPERTYILSQENCLFQICLVTCFLIGYITTEKFWLFLFNVGSGVHLRLGRDERSSFNLPIDRKSTQKHLGLLLDEKLNFSEHINEKLKKVIKNINLLRKLNLTLPRSSLLIIYKSFIRPHLDYGDIVYDQTNNSSLSEKIESLQYNAALAITDTIKSSSKEILCLELGFESLKYRRWMRKLCYLYKVISSKRLSYLYEILPPLHRTQRNQGFFQPLLCRTEIFKNYFLPYTINEWNKLNPEIRRIDSYVGFRKKILSFIKPMENKTFSIYDPLGIKLLNRLRFDLVT